MIKIILATNQQILDLSNVLKNKIKINSNQPILSKKAETFHSIIRKVRTLLLKKVKISPKMFPRLKNR
jgi:hypothetical protein